MEQQNEFEERQDLYTMSLNWQTSNYKWKFFFKAKDMGGMHSKT